MKNPDYNIKITEIENKLKDHNHTTPEFNELTEETFAGRLKEANLVTKTDFDDKWKVSIKRLTETKQAILMLKMNLKTTNIWFKLF